MPGVSICRCHFDQKRLSTNSFQQYGVQRPAQASAWSAKRQSEFLAGRYCAMKALTATAEMGTSLSTSQIPLRDDRRPQWPAGFVGSISHSDNRAIAITSSDRLFLGLGIDCETQFSDSLAAEIAPWLLHKNDLDCHLGIPINYGLLLTLIFSAKESLFKALTLRQDDIAGYNSFSVSRVTEKTLLLKAEFALKPPYQSINGFELAYTIEHRQIITAALLSRNSSA